MMYSPRLRDDQIEKLFHLREGFTRNGKKMTMAGMVREAVDEYIADLEDKEKIAEKYEQKEK